MLITMMTPPTVVTTIQNICFLLFIDYRENIGIISNDQWRIAEHLF